MSVFARLPEAKVVMRRKKHFPLVKALSRRGMFG